MSTRRFVWELLSLTILASLTIVLLNQWSIFAKTSSLSWVSILFFLGLTLFIYLMGKAAARSSNPNALTQLILGLVLGKLFCCLLIIVLYKKLADPSDHLYVVPFMVIYLIYTFYEVVLLNRLNRI